MILTRRLMLAAVAGACALPAGAQGPLPSLSVAEARARATAGTLLIVDVRTPAEWTETGIAAGAAKLEMSDREFPKKLDALKAANPGREIGLICRTANRSGFVQAQLAKLGYTGVYNIRGGMAGNPTDKGWIASGFPIEK